MNQGGGTLLGDAWRAIPRIWKVAGFLVLLGLAVWGIWGWVESVRRARLKAEIEAFLATLPPLLEVPTIPEEDNAGLDYLAAFKAVNLGAIEVMYVGGAKDSVHFSSDRKAGLAANAEAIRLFEVAVAKPAFAPIHSPTPARDWRFGTGWHLARLSRLKAEMEMEEGRVVSAVHYALLVPRMIRQVGYGRPFPWDMDPTRGLTGTLEVLETAVADLRLDAAAAEEILLHLPSGDELRLGGVAEFERTIMRDAGHDIADVLGPDGEAKAQAMGWRSPTVHQRLLVMMGKMKLPKGTKEFPSVSDIRTGWDSMLEHRAMVGRRGKEAVDRLATTLLPAGVIPDSNDEGGPWAPPLRMRISTEARLEVVRACAALRLFEMRNGRAATSLAELTPALLPAPTSDPFTGKPLLFEARPDGWTVSSEGTEADWRTDWASGPRKPSIRWVRPAPVLEDGGK